jgi:hypothetical protein
MPLELDGDLGELAVRVFPNFRDTSLCDMLTQRLSQARSLLDWFRSSALMPRIHAEIVALQFYASQRMRLVNEDRYIGCSKPSCYCCSLYMNAHPARIRPRPTHGNIWVQWCLPSADPGQNTTMTDLRILGHVADCSRDVAQIALVGGSFSHGKRFDSTTGLTISKMES